MEETVILLPAYLFFRTCKVPKSFDQANGAYDFIVKATLSHSQGNVCILDDQYHAAMPTCHQFQFSTCPISKRTETSPIFTAALRQPRETHCHPTGHYFFRTCKVPKSFDQANGAQMTLSSKLLSVTAKGMYAFWTINTMPPCPHAINSNSQHVQSASERKHLQSSLLRSDSQGKHIVILLDTIFFEHAKYLNLLIKRTEPR